MIIQSNKNPLKFIVDTGATNSIINPGLCNPKWKIPCEPIHIKTLQHTIHVTEKIRLPLFKEFGNSNEEIYFLVCKFHDTYDGIIGNDILKRFDAKIDYKLNQLEINNNTVPISFQNEKPCTIQLIVNQKNGLAYLKEKKFFEGKAIIKEGIYNVENHKIEIQTSEEFRNPIKLSPDEAIEVNNENFCILENFNNA